MHAMRVFVAVTDSDWYELLSSVAPLDEVNFWQPSGRTVFRALDPGELFLFKLHGPDDFVVGGGFFAHFSALPASVAWETFLEKNGANTLSEMKRRIERYRKRPASPVEDYTIGCILLQQPFFFPRELWIPIPPAWSRNIVRGKSYEVGEEPGRPLWAAVSERLSAVREFVPTVLSEPWRGRPVVVLPRLGQASFRVVVTDAYGRRCAVTGERVLPVLEAAHIKPFARGGENRVDNGLLLRRDFYQLFDVGYLTVTPALRVEVSRRIQEDYDNGREYFKLHGMSIRTPARPAWHPSPEHLRWHNEKVFRG